MLAEMDMVVFVASAIDVRKLPIPSKQTLHGLLVNPQVVQEFAYLFPYSMLLFSSAAWYTASTATFDGASYSPVGALGTPHWKLKCLSLMRHRNKIWPADLIRILHYLVHHQ